MVWLGQGQASLGRVFAARGARGGLESRDDAVTLTADRRPGGNWEECADEQGQGQSRGWVDRVRTLIHCCDCITKDTESPDHCELSNVWNSVEKVQFSSQTAWAKSQFLSELWPPAQGPSSLTPQSPQPMKWRKNRTYRTVMDGAWSMTGGHTHPPLRPHQARDGLREVM